MYYQTRLLPTDDRGQFLLAICHSEQKIGGEDIRETNQTRFASGHLRDPGELHELTAHCVLPRPASPAAAAYELERARQQSSYAQGSQPSSTAAYMRENALQTLHGAALAALPGVRVSRHVYASRHGTVLLGFEALPRSGSGESLPGVMQLLDVNSGEVIRQWSSSKSRAAPGPGVERFLNVQIGVPLGLSRDGTQVLLFCGSDPLNIVTCQLDADLTEIACMPASVRQFTALTEGWIAVGSASLVWLGPTLQVLQEMPVPRGALDWSMCATDNGGLLAMACADGADFLVVARSGAKPRKFSAHRGANKNARLILAISACGRWVASRWDAELALTRLADGRSWPVAILTDSQITETSHGDYQVRSVVPAAFAFVDSRLLVTEAGVVRELSLEEVASKSFVSEQGRPGARVPIRVKPGLDLQQTLRAARLEPQAHLLDPHFSPSVTMRTKALKKAGWLLPDQRGSAPLGSSRYGGWPDLPEQQAWPEWRGRPMAFLAQFNLAEAHAAEPRLRLPKTGLLSFFLGCTAETYQAEGDPRERYLVDMTVGTEPDAGAAWRVLYHPEAGQLQRRTWATVPLPQLFEPCSVRFLRAGLVLPNEDAAVYPLLTRAMDQAQTDDYNELVGLLRPREEQVHDQLMGYPLLFQGSPPELMCELSARGLSPWTYPDPGSESFDELAVSASKWALLLQLTSDTAADFCWGDGGHFYFYGDREAMEKGDFSKTWVNFEN